MKKLDLPCYSHWLLALFSYATLASTAGATTKNAPFANDNLIQRDVRRNAFVGWSGWSPYTPCSRTCEVGVAYRLRRCSGGGCLGRSVQYKLCNVQACPKGSLDFRYMQCTEFNHKPMHKYTDTWLPVENMQEPCSLTCKAATYGFSLKLRQQVVDGTLCRNGSRDVCVQGKCEPVGCDGELGSTKQFDECGVCGGDGWSCNKPVYVWRERGEYTPCDKTCGPDSWRVSISVCWDTRLHLTVAESNCGDQTRPRPRIEKCPYVPCPAEWMVTRWQECNATCSGGMQRRRVFCAERFNSSLGVIENREVNENYCWQNKKPDDWRACNLHQCPVWEEGEWTQCSVTCGKGYQFREVACRQDRMRDISLYACDPSTKPPAKQVCYTGVSCENAEKNQLADYERYRFLASAPSTQYGNSDGAFDGGVMDSKPTWTISSWSECSTTCGPGVKERKVSCTAFDQITHNTVNLPDYECEGEGKEKPSEHISCELLSCASSRTESSADRADKLPGKLVEYRWQYGDWEPCSASCLGGEQHRTLLCIQSDNMQRVAWSNCDARQRPARHRRTCNLNPCPPRWLEGEWSVCSHSCGKGSRTRQVDCVKDIDRADSRTEHVILTHGQCPKPVPSMWELCNQDVDCPAFWDTGAWSQCSTTCGEGQQNRLVACRQVLAGNKDVQHQPPTPCANLDIPPSIQLCSLSVTCGTPPPQLISTPKNFEQKQTHRKLTLRVGGQAKIFDGTSVKIKCPVQNYDRSRIQWTKNGKVLKSRGNVKVSGNGALRIAAFSRRDEGNYSCSAGAVAGSILLLYKSRTDSNTVYPSWKPAKFAAISRPAIETVPPPRPTSTSTTTAAAPTTAARASALDRAVYTVDKPDGSGEDDDDAADPIDRVEVLPANVETDAFGPRFTPHKTKDGALKDRATNDTGRGSKGGRSLVQELRQYAWQYNKTALFRTVNTLDSITELRFEWVTGKWSPCPITCGDVASMQVRVVKCQVRVNDVEDTVKEDLCVDYGLPQAPHSAETCGKGPCPQWLAANWTQCEESRCLKYHTAIQDRQVFCVLPNRTQLNDTFCARTSRPKLRRDCVNLQCVAEWRTSSWSECSKSCGGGVSMRTIGCYWNGTKKPAGNSCDGSQRPRIVRTCGEQSCPTGSHEQQTTRLGAGDGDGVQRQQQAAAWGAGGKGPDECQDDSKYCNVVRWMKLCDNKDYQRRCCFSCMLSRQKDSWRGSTARSMTSPTDDSREEGELHELALRHL